MPFKMNPPKPTITLNKGTRTSAPLSAHTADQETATDKPVGGKPSSGTANPNETGTY